MSTRPGSIVAPGADEVIHGELWEPFDGEEGDAFERRIVASLGEATGRARARENLR